MVLWVGVSLYFLHLLGEQYKKLIPMVCNNELVRILIIKKN